MLVSLTTVLFHMVVSLHYCYSWYFYVTDTEPGLLNVREPTFGGSYKFLTILCLILQLFYFFWCCITDLVTASAEQSYVARSAIEFRDWLLAAVVFPIGTLVVTIFWGIYAVDRELIFPEVLDKFFPSWLNHALHTFVLPLLLVEMLLVRHKYPSRTSGMLGTTFFGLAYLIWILYLGFAADIWVYPFLKVLEGPYFALFLAASAAFLLLIYIIGEKVNGLLGGNRKQTYMQKID